MKTIKQIADEIGVSKQAVSYRLKQLEATKENGVLSTKENGVLVVSLAGETLIKSAFSENNRQTFGDKQPPNNRQREDGVLAALQTTITVLQKQLETKDNQLAEKDKQIIELISTNKAQAQSINADRHAELAGTLQQQLISTANDDTSPDETEPITVIEPETDKPSPTLEELYDSMEEFYSRLREMDEEELETLSTKGYFEAFQELQRRKKEKKRGLSGLFRRKS
jgi:HPt (histidine-containing phosphotransfer) domain-containing protein